MLKSGLSPEEDSHCVHGATGSVRSTRLYYHLQMKITDTDEIWAESLIWRHLRLQKHDLRRLPLLERVSWERSGFHTPLENKRKKMNKMQPVTLGVLDCCLLTAEPDLFPAELRFLSCLKDLLTSAQRILGGELLRLGSTDGAVLWATEEKCCCDSV